MKAVVVQVQADAAKRERIPVTFIVIEQVGSGQLCR